MGKPAPTKLCLLTDWTTKEKLVSIKSHIIRANPPDPRYPRSILAISVEIRSIRLIRVLFLCEHYEILKRLSQK